MPRGEGDALCSLIGGTGNDLAGSNGRKGGAALRGAVSLPRCARSLQSSVLNPSAPPHPAATCGLFPATSVAASPSRLPPHAFALRGSAAHALRLSLHLPAFAQSVTSEAQPPRDAFGPGLLLLRPAVRQVRPQIAELTRSGVRAFLVWPEVARVSLDERVRRRFVRHTCKATAHDGRSVSMGCKCPCDCI